MNVTDEEINKIWYSHMMQYFSVRKGNQLQTHATHERTLKHARYKNPSTKDFMSHNPICRKCPERGGRGIQCDS